jgi:hypothetical protein
VYATTSRIPSELPGAESTVPALRQTEALGPTATMALLAIAYSDGSKFSVEVAGTGWPLG